MELRLKELEALTQEAKEGMALLQKQVEEVAPPLIPSTFPAPLAPRPPVVYRPALPRLPKIKVVKVKKGKSTKFTPEVCTQITQWVDDGLSREEIADRIGCSMNSLQVSCCKRGISLWAKNRPRNQEIKVIYEEVA
jgi:hypothetical protein